MAITKKIEKQLQELLRQFFIAYSPDAKESREILCYLFDGQMLPPFYADGELYETLLYLRYVVHSQRLDNLQSLQQYVDSKKLKISRFLSSLMSDKADHVGHFAPDRPTCELEAEKLPILDNYYEKICQLLETPAEPSMSRLRFSKVALMVHRLLNGDPSDNIRYTQYYQHCLRDLEKTYLEAFGIGMNSSGLYLIDRAGHSARSSDHTQAGKACIFDLNSFRSSFRPGRPFKKGAADQKYSRIMVQVKGERPIWGRQFKLLAMEWIFCSIDHRSNLASGDGNSFKALELLSRRWAILKCPSKQPWITSDNPGFKINIAAVESGDGLFWSSDLFCNTQERDVLYYPLSRDYCLRIDSGRDGNKEAPVSDDPVSFVYCSNKELNLVNRISAAAANELIVGSDKKILEQYVGKEPVFGKAELVAVVK